MVSRETLPYWLIVIGLVPIALSIVILLAYYVLKTAGYVTPADGKDVIAFVGTFASFGVLTSSQGIFLLVLKWRRNSSSDTTVGQ